MKQTVVPAQITTVEDRIAGSFTLPQIMLLVIAMVVGTVIYAGVPPKMHLGPIKSTLALIQFAIFGVLALRYNGKIVADWLIVYLRFKSRPSRYIFTKNDLIFREIVQAEEAEDAAASQTNAPENKSVTKPLTLLEERNLEKILHDDSLTVSFKASKKGGIDVSLEKKS